MKLCKTKFYFAVILLICVLPLCFSGCQSKKKKMQDNYNFFASQNYEDFQHINGKIKKIEIDYENKSAFIKLNVDSDLYEQMYRDSDKYYESAPYLYGNQGVYICEGSFDILKEEGFFKDNINEEVVITFLLHPDMRSMDWRYPVMGISVNNKIYLDFDTGKENWLNHLQKRILENGYLW